MCVSDSLRRVNLNCLLFSEAKGPRKRFAFCQLELCALTPGKEKLVFVRDRTYPCLGQSAFSSAQLRLRRDTAGKKFRFLFLRALSRPE